MFLLGETHGQRSLASYNPWGHKESDTAEWLSTESIYRLKGSQVLWKNDEKRITFEYTSGNFYYNYKTKKNVKLEKEAGNVQRHKIYVVIQTRICKENTEGIKGILYNTV